MARLTRMRLVVREDLFVEARMMMMSKCSSHLLLPQFSWRLFERIRKLAFRGS